MGVPVVYRKNQEPVIKSYDYIDFAAGAGYKRYYPCASQASGAINYFLAAQEVYGNPTSTTLASGVTPAADEYNFDLTFNATTTIQGKANVNAAIYVSAGSNMYIIATLYKVVSGVETQIGTTTTATRTPGGSPLYYMENILISLTKTSFSPGDILRLSLIYYRYRGSGSSNDFNYYDPIGKRTATDWESGTIELTTTLDIPFKIDI